MNRWVRKVLRAPRVLPGYLPLARKLKEHSAAIVMYHGVIESELPAFNWCQLSVDEFEKQASFLSQEYSVLPLHELIERLAGNQPLPPNAASITFDDGFRSVRDVAAPVLEKYDLPYTVFLVTSLVGTSNVPWPERLYSAIVRTDRRDIAVADMSFSLATGGERSNANQRLSSHLKRLPDDEKDDVLQDILTRLEASDSPPLFSVLDWEEVTTMARSPLAGFGSHTHTHPILSRCSPERQEEELRVSRDILRDHLGNADLFAYPNGAAGDFTDTTKKLVIDLGYKCGLATMPGTVEPGDDLYSLRRVNVGADTTFPQFQCLMLGW